MSILKCIFVAVAASFGALLIGKAAIYDNAGRPRESIASWLLGTACWFFGLLEAVGR